MIWDGDVTFSRSNSFSQMFTQPCFPKHKKLFIHNKTVALQNIWKLSCSMCWKKKVASSNQANGLVSRVWVGLN